MKVILSSLYQFLKFLDPAISYLGHATVITLAFRLFSLELQRLNLLLGVLYVVGEILLLLPFGTHALLLFLECRNFLCQLAELYLVLFAFYGLTLNLELFDMA